MSFSDPGRLNRRVTIQSVTETPDSFGEPAETWSDVATVWAAIEPILGEEFFQSGYWSGEVSHRITIRHLSGITTKHRVKYGSRVFDIKAVRNIDEANIQLELMCVEKEA